ncbi:MAG: HD-GYP domain-containing protein [Chloroflexi bacterium]|nr:HD-GYP domain-containing protein [Chloroflexota bacterium]
MLNRRLAKLKDPPIGRNSYRCPQPDIRVNRSELNTCVNVLEGLVEAVDGKDHYTKRHSEMVATLSLAAADRLRLSHEVRHTAHVAGLLHDVGKIGIPIGILRKRAPLTESEHQIMMEHPSLGARMIQELPHLMPVLIAIKHHHERFDGLGYPDGLKQSEIPLVSRIVAVADAYSAMTTDRPYRKALGHRAAVAELIREAGSQFDPEIVDLFLDILDSREGVVVAASA